MSLVDALILPPLPNLPEQSVSSNNHKHKKALFLTLNGLDQNVLMKLNSTSDTQVDILSLKRQEQQIEVHSPTQELQQQHHHYHHHHHHHHHYNHRHRIPSPPNHCDNTSFIMGANQEIDSTVAYTYTPITTPSSSPLTTPMDEEANIMSDDIITTTSTSGSMDNSNSNLNDAIKKKSITSRLKDALKKSNLSSRANAAAAAPNKKSNAANFSFLPSSSSPIPNTRNQLHHPLYPTTTADISKRHSTSSTLLTTTKKHQQLQEKHDSKARSWHPPPPPPPHTTSTTTKDHQTQCIINNNDATPTLTSSPSPLHQHRHYQYHLHIHHAEPSTPLSPASSATVSPLVLASPVVEKDTDCSPSSSTSSLTSPSPITPTNASSTQLNDATTKRENTTTSDMKVPFSPSASPTPLVQPAMPQSRFLTAFQKLRQQKPALDQSIGHFGTTSSSTMARSPRAPPSRVSADAPPPPPIMPSPSFATAGSKSSSFAEKLKTRFQSNLSSRPGQRHPPSAPLPPSSSRLPVMKSVTTAPMTATKSKTATAATKASAAKSNAKKVLGSSVYRPELASHTAPTSPMTQSWSHFSRSFAPSCSVQHASARYSPQKMKLGNKKNAKAKSTPQQQKQTNLMKGPRSPPPPPASRPDSRRSSQQYMSSPVSNQLEHNSAATLPPSVSCHQNSNENTTTPCHHPFDADTQVTPGNMIISPTCSTSSHHSSITTLSATESISSISTSTSPVSPRSSSNSPDSKTTNTEDRKTDDIIVSDIDKPSSSSSAFSVCCSSGSHLSLTSDHSSNKLESPISSTCSTAPTSSPSSDMESKACIAPIALSSPTPTATTTTTSTNPSSILTMKNKSSNAPQLTLKSPKRNLGKGNGAWNKHNKMAAPAPAPTKTKTIKHRHAILGDPFSSSSSSKSTSLNNKNKKKKKLRVRFISTAKVQDTFSKYDYDRASDPYAVCTRLTADLAQQIKDELNTFKLEEMVVHRQSRGNTQFFM